MIYQDLAVGIGVQFPPDDLLTKDVWVKPGTSELVVVERYDGAADKETFLNTLMVTVREAKLTFEAGSLDHKVELVAYVFVRPRGGCRLFVGCATVYTVLSLTTYGCDRTAWINRRHESWETRILEHLGPGHYVHATGVDDDGLEFYQKCLQESF